MTVDGADRPAATARPVLLLRCDFLMGEVLMIALMISVAFLWGVSGSGSFWQIGDWNVAETEGGCGFGQLFNEGRVPTDLKVLLFSDGRVAMMFKNTGWSVAKGTRGGMDIVLDDDVFSGPAVASSDHTLMMLPNSEMMTAFREASFITVFWNEKPIENMPLDGSAAAWAKAQECLAGVRNDEAEGEAEKRRLERRETDIPADPFKGR